MFRSAFLLLCSILALACAPQLAPQFEPVLGDDGGVRGDPEVDAGTPDAGARRLCPPGGGWVSLKPFAPRAEVGVAALNGEVYVAGGYNLQDYVVSTIEAYSYVTDSWRAVAPLPRILNHVNLAAYGGKLYALGALDAAFDAVGDSWAYDPATNAWTPLAPMPAGTERGAAAVGVVGSRIVVAGGLRGQSVTDVSAYEPATNTWTALPALPTARDHGVAAVFGDSFVSIGGRRNYAINGRVDVLTMGATSWVSRAPMKTPRAGCAATVIGHTALVVGGEGNRQRQDGIFTQVEVFDFGADTWTSVDIPPTPRHGTGGATVDGVAFFPGGAIVEGSGATGANEAWCP